MAERRTTGSSSAAEKDLGDQVEQLKTDVLELTESLKALGELKAADLKGKAKATAADIAAAGRGKIDDLSRSAAHLEEDVASYVREKPLQSLAIAAAFGVLLGLISRRG